MLFNAERHMGRIQEKSGGTSPWEVSSETSLWKSWDSVRWYSCGVRLPVRILDALRILHLAVKVSLDSLLEDGQVHSGTKASWGACSCLNSLSDLWLSLPLSFSPLLWTE